jgi:hypothetical protein
VWTAQTQTAAWCVIFFFASAGASAAYLTVSEIFPMETRALAIAFFYAVGTAIGGISGPLLFGKLVATKDVSQVFWGYILGAVLMILGGIVQALIGIEAAQKNLEDVAQPRSAQEAEGAEGAENAADQKHPTSQTATGCHLRAAFGGGCASGPASRARRGRRSCRLVAVGARRGHRRTSAGARQRAARGRPRWVFVTRASHPGPLPLLLPRPLPPRPRDRPEPRRHPPHPTIALRRRLISIGGNAPPWRSSARPRLRCSSNATLARLRLWKHRHTDLPSARQAPGGTPQNELPTNEVWWPSESAPSSSSDATGTGAMGELRFRFGPSAARKQQPRGRGWLGD